MTYSVSPFSHFSRDLSRFFDDHPARRQPVADRDWSPSIDIKESETEFQVIADVPGIAPEDIDINLHAGVLTIQGERKNEKEVDEKQVYRRERFYGRFIRQFNLPESADSSAVTANSVNGVLTVTIPKSEKAQPISITVNNG